MKHNKVSVTLNSNTNKSVKSDKAKPIIAFDEATRLAFEGAVNGMMNVEDDFKPVKINGTTLSAKVSKSRVVVVLALFSTLSASKPELFRNINFNGLTTILYLQYTSLPTQFLQYIPSVFPYYNEMSPKAFKNHDEFQYYLIDGLMSKAYEFNDLLKWGHFMLDIIYQMSPDYTSMLNSICKMLGISKKIFSETFIYGETNQVQADTAYADQMGQFLQYLKSGKTPAQLTELAKNDPNNGEFDDFIKQFEASQNQSDSSSKSKSETSKKVNK